MKKLTRRSFTAAGILAALGLTGCTDDFNPFSNRPAAVYGPPPDYDPGNNQVDDVYGPPPEDNEDEYDPQDNLPVAVYGPPEYFQQEPVAVDTTADSSHDEN